MITKTRTAPRLLGAVGAGLLVGALVGACGTASPVANAYPSAEAVIEVVLDGLRHRDRARLEAVALSEREFRDHVWPSLPASRPERNLPFAYVWGDLRQKSASALAETLARHGGEDYELLGVEFAGERDYGNYRLYRDTVIRVRDASGASRTLRLCGSLVEQDGAWKIFSYIVDG